jgi:Na+-driven multidrug efflux pump
MTLVGALVMLVLIAVIAFMAHWIITHFLPEPAKTPALAIVGVLLLLFVLLQLFPEVGGLRVWR